ncbi:hypothetical protein SHIRM173S_13149 [Streptomyces hirsutus]
MGADAQVAQQGDVLGVAVVVVAGDVSGVAALHRAGGCDCRCPRSTGRDRVLPDRSLDLVGRGRGAEDESGREGREVGHVPGVLLGACGGHLTEPPVMPAAMYFWARTSRIAAGTAESTDAAITAPQSPTWAPMYW